MSDHGDRAALGTVDFKFTSLSSGGSPMALANGTATIYRSNSTTESAAGVTLTPDFDGRTGVNHVHIETGADTIFYTPGNDYQVILVVGQIAGIKVDGYLLGEFSIGNRSALRPTTAGRTLDVSAGGEAGVDWSNIGAPTTTQNLSGTTVKTATDVETDTADIQTRLPAALVGGKMDSTVGAWQASAGTPLMPTTQGRTLDVTVTGEAGIDWNNIGAPTTTVNLSGTTVKTTTDVETDTQDIQSRLPAALTSGRMDSSVGAWQASAGTPLMPTAQGRTLDVTITGEGGVDWGNIGAPTTVVNLSGTTIKTVTDVLADTDDIQTRLPAALVGGRMDSIVNAWGAGTPLQPTTPGRTLDVTATGEGGIDWSNIGAPTTTQNLSGTSTKAVEPTIAGRTLDVTSTGEAGIDWSNIGAPTTVQNLSGTTVKAVTDALTIGTNNDKTGYTLTSAERDAVANALLDLSNAIETSLTMRQTCRLIAAALGGILAGAATTSITIRSAVSDSKVRITATVTADGNRTAFVYDLT